MKYGVAIGNQEKFFKFSEALSLLPEGFCLLQEEGGYTVLHFQVEEDKMLVTVGGSLDNLSYEKRQSAVTNVGQDYEVFVCALLFLRALRHCDDFFLASNHERAGAFDDVVLVYRRNPSERFKALLMQVKHRKNVKVTLKTLDLVDSNRADFSVGKYFNSYQSLRRRWNSVTISGAQLQLQDVTYVLYTNAESELGNAAVHLPPSGDLEALLQTRGHALKITRRRKIRGAFSNVQHMQRTDFFDNFVLLCGQMDHDSAKLFLDEEVRQVFRLDNHYSNDVFRLREAITTQLREWWSLRMQASYLTRDAAPWRAVVNAEVQRLNAKYCEKRHLQIIVDKVTFNPAKLQQLVTKLRESKCTALKVSDDHEAQLVRAKLFQALRGRSVFVEGEDVNTSLKQARSLWETVFYDWLVIDLFSSKELRTASVTLPNFYTAPTKRLVVITEGKIQALRPDDWSMVEMRTTWEDLDRDCASRLVSRSVNMQGRRINLAQYASSNRFVTDVLTAKFIVKLAVETEEQSELVLGGRLENVPEVFVTQHFERRTVMKRSFFTALRKGGECILAFVGISENELKRYVGENIKVEPYVYLMQQKCIQSMCAVALTLEFYQEQFSLLSNKHACPIYVLRFKSGHFMFLETSIGNGDGLDFVRKHIDSAIVTKDPIRDLLLNEKNVVVEGIPGMGKSLLLTWLAEEVKISDATQWVIRVDLAKYPDVLKNRPFSTSTDVKQFLLEVCLPDISSMVASSTSQYSDQDLAKTLLSQAINATGNVTLLVDGFDEISPEYAVQAVNLLTGIRRWIRYARMVVTTRPVTRQRVEDAVGIVAFTLAGLDKVQQCALLEKYLAHNNSTVSNAVQVIKDIMKVAGHCMEIPLFAATVAEELLLDLNEGRTVNFCGRAKLYAAFVEKHLRLFLFKHGMTQAAANQKEMLDMAKETISGKLMNLAAVTLLPEEEKKLMKFSDGDVGLSGTKLGLVVSSSVGRASFIHSSFGDFFLGMWLATKYSMFPDNYLRSKLFARGATLLRQSFDRYLFQNSSLHMAVADADATTIQTLLTTRNTKITPVDVGGRTPFHVAVLSDRQEHEVWALLLQYFEDFVDSKDFVLGWSALTYAEVMGNWGAANFLMGDGKSVAELALEGDETIARAVLLEACRSGYKQLTWRILKKHRALLNKSLDEAGSTALHKAVESGSLTLVKELVAAGANLRAVDKTGATPIRVAAAARRPAIVEFLRGKGCSLDGGFKRTRGICFCECMRFFWSSSVDTEVDRELIDAVFLRGPSAVHEVLNRGMVMDVNGKDAWGWAALHWAAATGNAAVVRALLQCNVVNVNATTDSVGDTALMLASTYGHPETTHELLQAGADVNFMNKHAHTAMSKALDGGYSEIISQLLIHGATPRVDLPSL